MEDLPHTTIPTTGLQNVHDQHLPANGKIIMVADLGMWLHFGYLQFCGCL